MATLTILRLALIRLSSFMQNAPLSVCLFFFLLANSDGDGDGDGVDTVVTFFCTGIGMQVERGMYIGREDRESGREKNWEENDDHGPRANASLCLSFLLSLLAMMTWLLLTSPSLSSLLVPPRMRVERRIDRERRQMERKRNKERE